MFVENHMTSKPTTVPPETSVRAASRILTETGFHQLPVVDACDNLIGIVTDRDLRSATVYDPSAHVDLRVEEIMTHDTECIRQDATLEDALTVLCRRRFNALPVVCNRRVVGIITKQDILMAFHDLLGLDQPGSRVEVAIPNGTADIAIAMQALDGDDKITAVLAARLRRDGDEPVLYIRTRAVNPQSLERQLRSRRVILLVPEKSKTVEL